MRLFAIRDFRHLFSAQIIALFRTGLATVALGLLAYELAGPSAGAVLATALTIKMVMYVLIAPLAAAYGLPKDTPEQAAHKAAVLEAALDGASAVPLQIMEKCAEGIALVEEYAAKGSVMAVSDAGCAAALCKAALQAASLNVFINTKLMADRERAAALDAKTDKLLDEFVSRADAVFASVTNKLRNK